MADAFFIQPAEEYFNSLVISGLETFKMEVSPPVVSYLGQVLSHYVDARRLFEPEFDENGKRNPQTLAELWLTAHQIEAQNRFELLKKLGEKSLYVSGFFSASLNRSLVDIDYYCAIGSSAYQSLAGLTKMPFRGIYDDMAHRFFHFVEVLNHISQSTSVHPDQSTLRLYETYLRTGSASAKQKLELLGVIVPDSVNLKKVSGQ